MNPSTNSLASRWNTFPRGQQILMLGNELNRALNAIGVDEVAVKNSLERTIDLVDLTLDSASRFSERLELARLRELLAGEYLQSKKIKKERIIALLKMIFQFSKESISQVKTLDKRFKLS